MMAPLRAYRILWPCLAGLAYASIAPAVATADTAQTQDTVVATVAGMEIKASDLQSLLSALDPVQRKAAASNLDSLTELVRRRCTELAVVKEAESKNWQNDPAVVAQIRAARDATVAASYLSAISTPPTDYPAESDIRAAFEKNKDRFLQPAQFGLLQLSVDRPDNADKGTLDRLEKFMADLEKRSHEKGVDFAKLAQPAAGSSGGSGSGVAVTYRDLGFVPADQLAPELRTSLAQANIGDVLPVLKLPNGYALLRLHDLKPATPASYGEMHDTLADALRRQKAIDNQQAAIKRILGKTPLAINQIAIGKMIPPK